jgi:hypothetical protein
MPQDEARQRVPLQHCVGTTKLCRIGDKNWHSEHFVRPYGVAFLKIRSRCRCDRLGALALAAPAT